MSTIDIIETRVRGFIEDIQHPNQKKKVNINDLEYQLEQQIEAYFDMDGYTLFYSAIEKLEVEGQLTPVKNSQQNGKSPSLSLYYWVNVKKVNTQWNRLDMLKLSNQFDFSYYEDHPEWQTQDEWKRIENLYTFLQSSTERPMVSLEERSIELFGHEKFLTDEQLFPEGKEFLNRIGVAIEFLKCTKLDEPFVFWLKVGKEIKDIKRVLIVEKLSFFHTCVHLLETGALDYEPELIIYGDGKKIERSFSFFFQMFPEQEYLFYYVGDIDAESFSSLSCLIKDNSEYCIQPALKIYRKMLECVGQAVHSIKQTKNIEHRNDFYKWFTDEEQEILIQLWQEKQRIPLEVLTIETWRRWM
ncbi:permease [Bacillus sp. JJ722]|uniref:permease n=1 Tax=Bacillus sp. JJ722 TaxID=3122973 RepID=UPI002FFDE115